MAPIHREASLPDYLWLPMPGDIDNGGPGLWTLDANVFVAVASNRP